MYCNPIREPVGSGITPPPNCFIYNSFRAWLCCLISACQGVFLVSAGLGSVIGSAHASDVKFTGEIVRLGVSRLLMPSPDIIIFNNEAGIRLVAINGEREKLKLIFRLIDQHDNLISFSGNFKGVYVAPETSIEKVYVVPIKATGKWRYRICAGLKKASGEVIEQKCQHLIIDSL